MSEYKQFLKERDQIDNLLESGFQIITVKEDLNGANVIFSKTNNENGEEAFEAVLHITNPNARKYFSAKIMQQQNSKA